MKLDASNNIIKRSDLEEILIEWLNKLKKKLQWGDYSDNQSNII